MILSDNEPICKNIRLNISKYVSHIFFIVLFCYDNTVSKEEITLIILPTEFKTKMSELLEDEASAFFNTYKEQRTAGLRINTLKINQNEWEKLNPFQTESIPFVSNGYYYDVNLDEPGKHPYHAAGLYYIQEPSAMFVANLLDAKPGEKVLDLCAAPGGKSTQIAVCMQNEGILISNEIFPKRAKALAENVERFGLKNTIVTNESPERLSEHFPNYFDKILVDAPCSGEGMFRKEPDAISHWSNEHVLECRHMQLNILEYAYSMLKEDGILVYSTCTFSPEENEQVIETFLERHDDIELLPINQQFGIDNGKPEWTKNNLQEITKTARLWPHKLQGEGHFAARLRKKGSPSESRVREYKYSKRQNLKDYIEFARTYFENITFDNLQLFGNVLHSLPENCPELKGLKVLRAGLHLGEMKKNRFEPDHALALALQASQFKQVVTLDSKDSDCLRYLKGETLKGSGKYKGWILITVDGFPLGWGKESNGTIKNSYPKGLRIMF